MTENKNDIKNYSDLGFMCGLEIHQRLATAEKLFCSCPTHGAKETTRLDPEISRYQRAVAGELGDVDRSALFEEKKRTRFVYRVNNEASCIVDLDEEPPHGMNNDALAVALSIAKSLGMTIPDELEPMRKEVVDGSNPSAFQRTTKVGMNGRITINDHEVLITGMMLEEESAGIIEKGEDSTVYDTSRIGIPLVEIDTYPYLRSPSEAKNVALRIGLLLRLTGKVQRGIGSIRQDVNVSISGGARTEIKGLQEVNTIDGFIENEVKRQQALLALKEEAESRGLGDPDRVIDITARLHSTSVRIVANELRAGGVVLGVRIPFGGGLLGREINPDRRLGSEISDYAKMGGVNGIIHSDEDLAAYGFSESELKEVRAALSVKPGDAFILIAGSKAKVYVAMDFALQRVSMVRQGVPLETRGVLNTDTCTTRFLRPLPGGSRMYPETDLTPINVTGDMLARAMTDAPNPALEEEQLMKDIGNAATTQQLLLSSYLQLYHNIASKTTADRRFVANVLLQKFTELRRAGYSVDVIGEQRIVDVFSRYSSAKITKQGVEEIIKLLSKKDASVDAAIKELGAGRISGKDLERLVEKVSAELQDASPELLAKAIMSKHRLNVDGEELHLMLKRLSK
jgi:glutamyl-tRNA(Gln) amidotransferase subunit E